MLFHSDSSTSYAYEQILANSIVKITNNQLYFIKILPTKYTNSIPLERKELDLVVTGDKS